MKFQIPMIAGLIFLSACDRREPKEVTATEVRQPSTRDGEFVLEASSQQRFGGVADEDKAAAAYQDIAPEGWVQMAATAFRIKNYRFGSAGEVYLSESAGSVLDNTNRWLGQFSISPINEEAIAEFPKIDFLGEKAYWVQADGMFAGGMGKAPASGYALRGVIAKHNGAIVTVKMIGPKDEVAAQEQALRDYVGCIKSAD